MRVSRDQSANAEALLIGVASAFAPEGKEVTLREPFCTWIIEAGSRAATGLNMRKIDLFMVCGLLRRNFRRLYGGIIGATKLWLLQTESEVDRAAIIERDPIVVCDVGRERFRADVEDPLLRQGIPTKAGIWRGRDDGFIHRVDQRAGECLSQQEANDQAGRAHRFPAAVTHAELDRYSAALLEDTRAVSVDGLQDLVARVSIARSATGIGHRVGICDIR